MNKNVCDTVYINGEISSEMLVSFLKIKLKKDSRRLEIYGKEEQYLC